MNVFTIASIIILVTLLLAFLIGLVFVRLSRLVVEAEQEVEAAKSRYNPRQTLGLKIPVQADLQEQLKEARRLAARRAAMLPRGANLGIGRKEEKSELRTASKGLEKDPISAVKIAAYHTWQGAITGPTEAQPVAPTNGAAVGQKMVKRKLVPGKDFPYTEVTPDMPGPERRRIRIQNSKAKMAAYKEMKESGQDMVAAPAAAQAQPAAAGAQPAAAPSMDIPPEPDYVEITDDMEAAEVRKARINNSKMRSAYNKKLKELGLDPKEVEKMRKAGEQPTVPAQAQAQPAAAAPAQQAAPAMPSDIPPEPDYVEITDDMEAAEVRKARINNSKMRSAYNKKLKEMGLDPKEVEKMREAASQPAAQAQPAAAAQAAPQQQQAAPAVDLPPEPDYVEITDDMEPAEIRKARIDNAKMRSAYNKKLKEMGIDPKSVNK